MVHLRIIQIDFLNCIIQNSVDIQFQIFQSKTFPDFWQVGLCLRKAIMDVQTVTGLQGQCCAEHYEAVSNVNGAGKSRRKSQMIKQQKLAKIPFRCKIFNFRFWHIDFR